MLAITIIYLQATRAAISQAFKTPEVIRLFGRREPKLLREKLNNVELDFKLGKISAAAADQQKVGDLFQIRCNYYRLCDVFY